MKFTTHKCYTNLNIDKDKMGDNSKRRNPIEIVVPVRSLAEVN